MKSLGRPLLIVTLLSSASAYAAWPETLRACASYLTPWRPKSSPPAAVRLDRHLRDIARARRSDPQWRPTAERYDERVRDLELLTEPAYFWYPSNAWYEVFSEMYPETMRVARATHGDEIIPLPREIAGVRVISIEELADEPASPSTSASASVRDTSDLGDPSQWEHFGRALSDRRDPGR